MNEPRTNTENVTRHSVSSVRRAGHLWRRAALVIVTWLVLFGLLVAARRYTFQSPIVHDEGVFLYGGMAWAAGEVAYRDFWDHKPPGITLFHAIPIRLFGYSLLAVRLHEVFWLAISATIFVYLCRRTSPLSQPWSPFSFTAYSSARNW